MQLLNTLQNVHAWWHWCVVNTPRRLELPECKPRAAGGRRHGGRCALQPGEGLWESWLSSPALVITCCSGEVPYLV